MDKFRSKLPEYKLRQGSGGGSVGRAVTLYYRGSLFESDHWQKFILNINCQLY